MNKNKKGFTLIEMMVVIAIIAVLVSVIVPVMTGNTDKAAAATNAANLRGVEGELVAMMLIDPYAFGDQELLQLEIDLKQFGSDLYTDAYNEQVAKRDAAQAIINNLTEENVQALRDAVSVAQAACDALGSWCPQYLKDKLAAAQTKLTDAETAKAAATKALNEANAALDALEKENQAYKEQLAKDEHDLYYLPVTDGKITLKNGQVIHVPSSEKVNKDGVTIDKDVPMSVFVDTTEIKAYTYYETEGGTQYKAADFAAVAE